MSSYSLDTAQLRLDPESLSPGTHHCDWCDYRNLTPKQRLALDLCVSHPSAKVLYGGAGFCGKSYLLRSAAVYFAILFAALGFPGQRGMLCCKDYPTLKGRHVEKLCSELGLFGDFKNDDAVHGMCFKFRDPNLGVLLLRNLDDPDKYRGQEVSYILVDELTELSKDTLSGLLYCLRSHHNLPFMPFLAGSNPDGPGFGWVKKLWVSKDFKDESYNPKQFFFIQALTTDNPNLDKNAYIETLGSLPDHIRRARLEGSWDAPEGARWPNLDPDLHQFRLGERFPGGVPAGAEIIMGVDWGIKDPYCALWIFKLDNGLYVFREDYRKDLPSEEQAKRIGRLTKDNETVQRVYCDSQMWERKRDPHRVSAPTGESAGDVYIQILRQDGRFKSIQPAYKGPRIHPLGTIDRLLARNNNYPDLYIERSCTNLWRELEGATWDSREGIKREDIDPKNDDHAITALYYALHTYLVGIYKPVTSLESAKKDSWLIKVEEEEQRYLHELCIRGGKRRGRF